ncbi:MAG: nucleoside-diphosphate kinase [Armatimonadota bacterium]
MEETLVIVKPDAVERGLVGEIISRFEAAGFEIARMRFGDFGEGLMQDLYAEHEAKPHFPRLIAYMTSGPCCYLELRREGAIERARALVGNTDPAEAAAGTIRGDMGLDLPRNSVHASDCADAARCEIDLIFDGEVGTPEE